MSVTLFYTRENKDNDFDSSWPHLAIVEKKEEEQKAKEEEEED